jgi:hypothetical protein
LPPPLRHRTVVRPVDAAARRKEVWPRPRAAAMVAAGWGQKNRTGENIMTIRDQSARMMAGGGQRTWWPVVVLPVLAFIVNAGIYYLGTKGLRFGVPINLIGGFSLVVSPAPVLESVILALALWWWSGLSAASAFVAAIVFIVVRMIATFGWGYLMSKVMPLIPLSVLTQSTAFYGPLFLQAAVTGASVLLVLTIYEPAFRAWWPWILTLLIWAGGTTLLFVLYHDQVIAASYPWLAHFARALGFVVIGWAFRRPQRHFR